MSLFNRPTPSNKRIILYCFLSVGLLYLLGRIVAFFQWG